MRGDHSFVDGQISDHVLCAEFAVTSIGRLSGSPDLVDEGVLISDLVGEVRGEVLERVGVEKHVTFRNLTQVGQDRCVERFGETVQLNPDIWLDLFLRQVSDCPFTIRASIYAAR